MMRKERVLTEQGHPCKRVGDAPSAELRARRPAGGGTDSARMVVTEFGHPLAGERGNGWSREAKTRAGKRNAITVFALGGLLLLQSHGLEAQKKEEPQAPVKAEENVFLADANWEYDGFIVGERDRKAIIGQGDTIFIDLGKKQKVMRYDRFTIYRRAREVTHPDTGEPLGFLLRKIGVVEVTADVQDNTATARVVMTHEPLFVGDFVKRQPPPEDKKKKGRTGQTGR